MRPGHGNGESEKQRDEQNLEDVALGESVHDGIGNDVEEKFCDTLCLRLSGITSHGLGIKSRWIDVEPPSRVCKIADDQSEEQRQSGDQFEVEEGLAAYAADLLHVFHTGNASDERAENHQCDDHGDHADECVTEGLHGGGSRRADISENNGK